MLCRKRYKCGYFQFVMPLGSTEDWLSLKQLPKNASELRSVIMMDQHARGAAVPEVMPWSHTYTEIDVPDHPDFTLVAV